MKFTSVSVVLSALLTTAVLSVLPVPPAVSSTGKHHSTTAIDTSDRAAVTAAWLTRMNADTAVPSGWTGSASGCRAGAPSAAAQAATLDAVNFVRDLAGLDEVTFQASLSRKAQAAALIMAANQTISHTPGKTWACYTKAGAKAAALSNLAIATPAMTAGQAVWLYAEDAGSTNKQAGHRRWLLDPDATKFGNGLTSTTNALLVHGKTAAKASTGANPAWVSWPTAGWFPSALEPQGRWSLASGSVTASFKKATVSVTSHGVALPVKVFRPKLGYGRPTLVFQVSGLAAVGSYVVTVSGIKHAAATKRTYTVNLFQP